MGKCSASLSAATTALLLAAGACATRDDIEALRADFAALQASIRSAEANRASAVAPEYQQLRSEIAALQASIRSAEADRATGTTAPSGEYQTLRSDIAALRALIAAETPYGAGSAAGAVAAMAPPPTGYEKVSKLAKLPEFIPGLGALYVRPQTLPAGPFLGYDRDDRLVNTVYMIPLADMNARKTFAHLAASGRAVQEVEFYYTPGHPGVEQPHYHVILWHLPQETAKLQ